MTRFRDRWDEESRQAQTERSRAVQAERFARRVETYRVLTREKNLPRKAVLRRMGLKDPSAARRYEAAIRSRAGTAALARAALALAYLVELNRAGVS